MWRIRAALTPGVVLLIIEEGLCCSLLVLRVQSRQPMNFISNSLPYDSVLHMLLVQVNAKHCFILCNIPAA